MRRKIIAINYANEYFQNAQELNAETALMHGADNVIKYHISDIDELFYKKNRKILEQKRGGRLLVMEAIYYKKTLVNMQPDEYLVYSDSGACYINDINLLINCMKRENMEIMVFAQPSNLWEKEWSKRDAFILMECDFEKYYNTPQRLAGFLVIQNTLFTNKFISEWLFYAQDSRIITDQENCMGKENYPGFKEHRHDQTILSLLSKKYELKVFRDPSYACTENARDILIRSSYPKIFDLHRLPDVLTIEDIQRKRIELAEQLLKYWENDYPIVLYGAGKNAKRVLSYVRQKGFEVALCVVSDNQTIKEPIISGVKVVHFSDVTGMKENLKILSTINLPEVCELLKASGCKYEIIDGKILSAISFII